jgi:hypothetical protein
MLISLDRTGTVESLAALMADTTAHPGVAGLMVLACDANGFSPEKLDSLLQGSPLPVFGGIFPQIIHGCDHLERGTLVIGPPRGAAAVGDHGAELSGNRLRRRHVGHR